MYGGVLGTREWINKNIQGLCPHGAYLLVEKIDTQINL